MCILCVASRWSRKILAVIPWLVIPLILLWAVSQMLPPGYRFEVTSERLACIIVLLVSLLWYEILMPRLYAWRERRNALLRERRRIAMLKAAKWRKEAIRRCRNCMAPYKDQNPVSGRFMCMCCGHVSRRPVLDISNVTIPGDSVGDSVAGFALPRSILQRRFANLPSVLQGKSVKIWDGKVWKVLDCQLWPSEQRKQASLKKTLLLDTCCGSVKRCTAERSYSSAVDIVLRILGLFFSRLTVAFKKLSKGVSSSDDAGSNYTRKTSSRKGEDGVSTQDKRGERARRKAEEKRQARLLKEMLEEEERKQREEVSRLVEERRRQKAGIREAEKTEERHSFCDNGTEKEISLVQKNRKEKETDKRRHGKRKGRNCIEGESHASADDAKKKVEKETHKASPEYLDKARYLSDTKSDEYGSNGAINGTAKCIVSNNVRISKASKFSLPEGKKRNSLWGNSRRAGPNIGSRSSRQQSTGSVCESLKQKSSSTWSSIPWTNVWGNSNNSAVHNISSEVIVTEDARKVDTGSVEMTKAFLKVSSDMTLDSSVRVEPQTLSELTSQPKAWQQIATGIVNSPSSVKSPSFGNHLDTCDLDARGNSSQLADVQSSVSLKSLDTGSSTEYTPVTLISRSSGAVSISNHELSSEALRPPSDIANIMSQASVKMDLEDSILSSDPISLLGPLSEDLDNFPSELDSESLSCRQRACAPSGICSPISPPVSRSRSTDCTVSELLPSEIIDICPPPDGPSDPKLDFSDVNKAQLPTITEPWGLPSLTLNGSSCASELSKWQLWNASQIPKIERDNHGATSDCLLSKRNMLTESSQTDLHFTNVSSRCQTTLLSPQTNCLNSHSVEPLMDCWTGSDYHPSHLNSSDDKNADSEKAVNHLDDLENEFYRDSSTDAWFKSLGIDAKRGENICGEGTKASFWASSLTRPPIGGIYLAPDVQSVWSYK